MTKSIADLYNEVQNIANGNRRLDLAGQWEHAATPGNIPFDTTNNDYMRDVVEAQSKMQENRAAYIKNNYKKEVPIAAPVPGPAPIPTMKDPKMVTTPSDKKPATMREALEQVRINEGEAWDATKRGVANVLRGDVGGVGRAAVDWASATGRNVARGAEVAANALDPQGAKPSITASAQAAPTNANRIAPAPAMASAPPPSAAPAPVAKAKPTPASASIQDIARANKIKDQNKIYAGKTLDINGQKYTIQKGDTLTGIANKFKNKPTETPLPPRRPAPQSGISPAPSGISPAPRTAVPTSNIPTPKLTPASTGAPLRMPANLSGTAAPAPVKTTSASDFVRSQGVGVKPTVTAQAAPGSVDNYEKRLRLNNSYENPLIKSFLQLQETQGNLFAEAKKKSSQAGKYNNGDKDEINDDPGKGDVVNSQAPGAVSENTNIPGHRRLSMFDPSQGYARTAGSADGAKERLEALWGAVTGEQTAHRDPGLADAIRADLAAIKEEFGDEYDEEIYAITEALGELMEAPSNKDHDLAKLAAAAIAKGHPVKKLPVGKAEGWADNRRPGFMPKSGRVVNDEKGMRKRAYTKTEETIFSEEELAHIQSILEGNPINNASVEGPSSSDQAAKGSQVDKNTLTDNKKKL